MANYHWGYTHWCHPTRICSGGRNDSAYWKYVNCPSCLVSAPLRVRIINKLKKIDKLVSDELLVILVFGTILTVAVSIICLLG